MPSRSLILAVIGAISALPFVVAQSDYSPEGQLDPAATCPYQLADQIQACRAIVYADEAKLPGGPCTTTDWACICNVQQGLVSCYYPCRGTTPRSDIDFNNAQCNGQNGVTNAAAANNGGGAVYSGSQITTSIPANLSSIASQTVRTATSSLSSPASSASTTTASSTTGMTTASPPSSVSSAPAPLSTNAATSLLRGAADVLLLLMLGVGAVLVAQGTTDHLHMG